MLRPPFVRAATLALLLVGATASLALAGSSPPPRVSSIRPGIFVEVWSILRSLVTYLGHVVEVDPSVAQLPSPDAGHDIDPNG